MSEERITEAQERQLLAAVRSAIAQTNDGVDPNVALAKAAADQNYGPDFVERMVEMYNTSRTLAHLKHASGDERAVDFPIADAQEVLGRMFSVDPRREDIEGGEMGKAANLMRLRLHEDEEPLFEKAAAYQHDGSAKFQKVLNAVRDLEQGIVNLRTKRAEHEVKRDGALYKAATYFRTSGHVPFEDVDSRMQSMYGRAGRLAMDVIWDSVEGLKTEKRAEAPTSPRLARMSDEPYCYIDQFIERSKTMAELGQRISEKTAELEELKAALKERVGKACKEASGLASAATIGLVGRALEGSPALSGEATGEKAQARMIQRATDPAHENALRGIQTETMLQDLMSSDPVISQYDPADVVDAYNELSRMSPVASSQPVVLRGYLRRLLESSPDVAGRVLEGHEAGQLADIEKTMRGGRESVKDVLSAVGGRVSG